MKKFLFGCMFLILATLVFGQMGGSGQRGEMPNDYSYNNNRYARIEFTTSGTFTFEEYRWWRGSALGVADQDEAFLVLRCSGTYILDGDKLTLSWSGTIESNNFSYNAFGSRKRGSTTRTSDSGTSTGTFTSHGSGFTIAGIKYGYFSFNGTYNP